MFGKLFKTKLQQALPRLTANDETLTTLDLDNKKIGNEGATELAESLRHNTTLTTLCLSSNEIGDEGATAFAESLRHNTTSTKLQLSWNNIGTEGAKALAESLLHNTTLITLNLSWNDIGNEGAKSLAKSIRQNMTLTTLQLSWNNIGDEGAKAFAELLYHNTTLTTLYLNHNKIGDEGTKALAESLRHNKTLTTLDLSRNKIGVGGQNAILNALEYNDSLIDLSMIFTSDDTKQKMKGLLDGNKKNTRVKRNPPPLQAIKKEQTTEQPREEADQKTLKIAKMKTTKLQNVLPLLTANDSTLTTLHLSSKNIGVKGATELVESLRQNTTLTTLYLSSNNIGDEGAKALAESLRHNKTLTTFDLSWNNLGVEGAKALAKSLRRNTTLTTLKLNYNRIGDEGAKALAERLHQNTTIRALDLSWNKIGNKGAKALAELLCHNTTLTELSLSSNKSGDKGAKALAESLRHNTSLITFYLSSIEIGDEGAIALAESLYHNTTLTTLHLNHNNIGDEGTKAVAESLHHNTILTTLDLSWNNIGNKGAKTLAESLYHNTTLTTLHLSSNEIGDEGAKALAESLHHNNSLSTVYLIHNKFGVQGQNAILETLEYNDSLIDLSMIFTSDDAEQKIKGLLDGNKKNARVKRKPPPSHAIKKERAKTEPKEEADQETIKIAKIKIQKYKGSEIRSRDEFVLTHKHLEKELMAARFHAQKNFGSEEAIAALEDVNSRLEQIKEIGESQDSNLGLLSLEELEAVGLRLKDEMESKLESLKSEYKNAMAASSPDFQKLKELNSKAKEVRESEEKRIQDAEARFVEAKASLEVRRQEFAAASGALPISASPPGMKILEGLEESRSIIKMTLESRSSHQGPPKKVSLDYLAHLTDNWSSDCVLGSGGQGKVYRGYDRSLNCLVAVKQIFKFGNKRKGSFEREIMALAKLDHPNIVRILARCETDSLFDHLVYEYAAGGTLTKALNSVQSTFTWQRRVGAIMSLVHALQYCHANKVKHRDVKPDNICFQDEGFRQLLLIDFGIATKAENTGTSYGGTPSYMAPEYLLGRTYFDEPQEVYSVGVVMISLVLGKTTATELIDMKERIFKEPQPQQYLATQADSQGGTWNQDVLQAVCKLAHSCICDNPELRPTFGRILTILASLRSTFTTQMTEDQSTALQQALNMSFSGSTPSKKQEQICACGGKAVGGVFCQNDHYQCILCLEGSVKRQMGSEHICCQIGSCDAEFEIADLYQIVDCELLAEHAHEQKLIQDGRIRDACMNEEMWKRFKHSEKQWLKNHLSGIAAGIGTLASCRGACPSLCVLWPCKSGRLNPQRLYCKVYHFYFLCAYDRTPTTSSILVVKRRKWVKKVAPVLKYSIMAFKLMNTLYGIPLPLPDCISPGSDGLEKLSKLTESLSDILGIEDYQKWASGLADLEQNLDKASLKKFLYQGAEDVDAEAHAAIAKMANKEGNLGWKDEMRYAHNRQNEWAYVKKSNIKFWEQDG